LDDTQDRHNPALAPARGLAFSAPMAKRLFIPTIVFLALALSLCAADAPAAGQTPPVEAPAAAAPEFPSTVTAEMGDVGGKYFGQSPDPAKVRHYYIAAEPDLWDFTPDGQDAVCGKQLPTQVLLNRVSWKIRYVQYADADFSARVLPAERLGMLGPVLRGTTGQYLVITVLNRSWQSISLHPHGVHYDKDSEGSYYKPNPGLGAALAPGAKFTYVWYLDEASGPQPNEPSSKAWLYHSHVTGDEEINLGLFGFLIVTDPARARVDGTPRDVDREMAGMFTIFDESSLPDSDNDDERTADTPTGPVQRTWAEIQRISEEGERHTINGRSFGNLAGLEMNQGERVRWYMFGLGSEKDFHTAHWHGVRVLEDGRRRTDVVELLPGSMKVADMVADNPGSWLLHCHVAEHMGQGMFAKFTVHPTGSAGVSRTSEAAFFGTREAEQTLRLGNAELSVKPGRPEETEVNLSGQVTVPDPYPTAGKPFVVQMGAWKTEFVPDASGLCVAKDGILVVKNSSLVGNGVVKGGTLNFDLTIKGSAVHHELEQMHLLEGGKEAANSSMHLDLTVGAAHHASAVALKLAPQ
jgi:FtsP/CotA-like multicopper oxidase with cupredoxin domain